MSSKSDKLVLLFKRAVREVLKEELSQIIKTVMNETAQQVTSIRSSAPLREESYIEPKVRKPATQRVFFEDDIKLQPQVSNAAENIREGRFNLNDLKDIVTTDDPNDPLADVSDSQVDDFINKMMTGS